MSKLRAAQAELLDVLLQKHAAGKLAWHPRQNEDSFETELGTHAVHVDRKPLGVRLNYRIWVFNQTTGTPVLTFDTTDLGEMKPKSDQFENYTQVAAFIYEDVRDTQVLNQLDGVMNELKAK